MIIRVRCVRRRRLAGVLVAGLLVGCGGGKAKSDASVTHTVANTFQASLSRRIDILFAIDSSSLMENAQENLRANIGAFVDVLEALPGGMPDVHIAVASADMGVGHNDIPGCNATGGDNGIFHSGVGVGARDCPATGLDAGATYVSSTGGATPQNNFTGDIRQVLRCILPIGAASCGFEQQLKSIARALGADGFDPPSENAGFLRPEASLAIIILTNEDDCSAASVDVYDVLTNTSLSSPLGPPGNFRCAEFGHLCGSPGAPPRRTAPNGLVTDTVSYENCVSSEGQGKLIPVASFAAAIKSLKPDPDAQIMVASIQGPVMPYRIKWMMPRVMTDGPWPVIEHSCTVTTATMSSFADAGVRIQQFVQSFGARGRVFSFCDESFGRALTAVAADAAGTLPGNCLTGTLLDADRDPSNGVQPECAVSDHVPNASGTGTVGSAVAECAKNGNTPPCWALVPPAASVSCPANSNVLEINRGGETPPANTRVTVECLICAPGISDPAAGCP
jgi:hypothetical protein